tara:strand:+ start:1547 stop:1756 length:210 start_codon:yes stop_codon:yes gene_type:complete
MNNRVVELFNLMDEFPDRETIKKTLKNHKIPLQEYTIIEVEFELFINSPVNKRLGIMKELKTRWKQQLS